MNTLHKHVTKYIKNRNSACHKFLKIWPDEHNCERVYILGYNANLLNDKLSSSATYLFEFNIHNTKWPHNPPYVYVLTPNGIFAINSNICTSNGVYHPEKFVSLPIEEQVFSMYMAIVTNDPHLDEGIGITPYSAKRETKIIKYSTTANKYNKNTHGEIMKKIEDFYNEYSAKWIQPDDMERYAPDPTRNYIQLPNGLKANHNTRVLTATAEPPTWPKLHPSWNIVETSIVGMAVPVGMTLIIRDPCDDDLLALGL